MTPPLSIEGLANARDLGGMPRSNGSSTPTGVFIRAEGLDRVTEAGWDSLRAHGVRTVIDLRRPSERTVHLPADIDLVAVDLDGEDEREFWEPYERDGRWSTPLYYQAHLERLPRKLGSALQAIATAASGAILFHCSAGWDRTGLLAAVLLRTVGVTEAAATKDYLTSFNNADAMGALHRRSFDVEERHAVLAKFGHTARSAFAGVYANLDVTALFSASGLSARSQAALETWRGSVNSS